jgi:hypothetical protein
MSLNFTSNYVAAWVSIGSMRLVMLRILPLCYNPLTSYFSEQP